MTEKQDLIGYWKLDADCQDSSGNGNHGANHGVKFSTMGTGKKSGCFNGRNSFIEVAHNKTLAFGSDDFTISAMINTEASLKGAIGNIVGKFDTAKRRGINLTVLHHAGMTLNQSNHRNLFFGIDNAVADEKWTDCGKPGNAIFVSGMTVFEGDLYVGTCEPGVGETGHVYRYLGGDRWEDCGSPAFSDAEFDLTNDVPLTLGFGTHDYFHGKMSEVRMYRRALSENEIAVLSHEISNH